MSPQKELLRANNSQHLRIWPYLAMGSQQMELVEITGVLRRGKRQVEKAPVRQGSETAVLRL